MKTKHDVCSVHSTCCLLRKLPALFMGCMVGLAAAAASAHPQRPSVPRGGDNWIPRASQRVGLTTQDLNSGLTPTDLVTALLGPGVTVSNVTFTGANVAAGTFAGGTGIIGFSSGIVLSSGSVAFVPGPNLQDSTSGVNQGLGDPDLAGLIPGYTIYDACVLEFDFQCTGTQVIQFQYVFTSEEYNEWVNTAFNDVFGFFLNGVNIALIPGSAGTPVSINNLNCDNPFNPPAGSFCNLFINNRCADIPPGLFPCVGARDTEMDGLTVVLTATGTLQPGTNHIKLALSDAGDQVLDSNVFIQGQSFACGIPTGACCNTVTHTCVDNVPQTSCQGPNEVFSVGLACNQLNPPCTTVAPPAGTSCTNPIPITTIPFVDTNTTNDKANDYTGTCLGQYDNGKDILYRLEIQTARCIDITVAGATPNDNWIGVALHDACPPAAVCLAQATSQGSVATITGLNLAAGTYYLMIDRWPLSSDSLDFTLSIADCAGAPTGACCNTLTHVCTDDVLAVNCQGPDQVWSAGVPCGQLDPPCNAEVDTTGQDCEFPIVVTSVPFDDVNTTAGKKEDYSNTCLGIYDGGDDIIYRIVLSSAHCVDITVAGATANDFAFGVVLDDVCPPGLNCRAQAIAQGTMAAITGLQLPAGTYYLMIDRDPKAGAGATLDFRLTIADCPAPSGACCLQNGSCAELTEADCLAANGVSWVVDTLCSPSPCPYAKGDMNCDHVVNAGDLPLFVDALLGTYAGCDITLADMNSSGVADGDDIPLFTAALMGF